MLGFSLIAMARPFTSTYPLSAPARAADSTVILTSAYNSSFTFQSYSSSCTTMARFKGPSRCLNKRCQAVGLDVAVSYPFPSRGYLPCPRFTGSPFRSSISHLPVRDVVRWTKGDHLGGPGDRSLDDRCPRTYFSIHPASLSPFFRYTGAVSSPDMVPEFVASSQTHTAPVSSTFPR